MVFLVETPPLLSDQFSYEVEGVFYYHVHHKRFWVCKTFDSNKKYNRYLKNIEKEIGFEDPKPLTSHRLRHTFGMRCVNDLKIQIHIVARMMGDDQETIMNNYADLTPDNIILEQKQQTNLFEGVNKKTQNSNN